MTVTRFAPSPTGYLHVGGLRTALYAYLIAKQNKGKFLLRIEDTDRERFVADGTEAILKSLYWTNLAPDEGVKMECTAENECAVIQEGTNGPYIQSERLEIYKEHAQKLLSAGQAYYCFCDQNRLAELRKHQEEHKLPTGYDGFCRKIDTEEAQKRINNGEKYVIRMKMSQEGETVFNDLVRGEVRIMNSLVDDQVIIKSDGFPTYHLAVVVDDHLMKITHIIRGEEWLSSVPKHLQLYEYFGWEAPVMAHLPLILNPDKTKLSKRQGDVAVEDYRKKGYLPEALINFLAFLGWNPGGEKEVYTLEELIKDFSLEKVGKAGAIFNLKKLDWFNQQYIKKLSSKDLLSKSLPFLEEAGLIKPGAKLDKNELNRLEKSLELERERVVTLSELPEAIRFVFGLPEYEKELLVWKESTAEEAKNILEELGELLNNFSVQDWNKTEIEKRVGEWMEKKDLCRGCVLSPLRVALSGQKNSPGPYEIAEVLGKEESLKRLEIAFKKL